MVSDCVRGDITSQVGIDAAANAANACGYGQAVASLVSVKLGTVRAL